MKPIEQAKLRVQKAGGHDIYFFENTSGQYAISEVFIDNVYDGLDFEESDIVLNIGGHIGAFDVKYAKKVMRMYTFEPQKENYSLLKLNLSRNAINNVVPYNKAVNNIGGKVDLYTEGEPCSGLNSLIKTDKLSDVEEVEAISIGEVLTLDDFTKIKCDCEGGEYEIFKGLVIPQTIKQIIMEVHPFKVNWNPEQELVIEKLQEQFTDVKISNIETNDSGKQLAYLLILKR